MAELPKGAREAGLLDTQAIFQVEDERYFFMPGFPEMSHPMTEEILKKLIPNNREYYRHTLTAFCKENELIEVMEKMPKEVEFSSLPKLYSDGWRVSISVASHNKKLALVSFKMYIDTLDKKKIIYTFDNQV